MEMQELLHSPSPRHEIEAGALYKHYKGNVYKIIQIARFSEDPETLMVIYQGLYNCQTYGENPVWCRPLSMFIENITVNGTLQPRFSKREPQKL